MPLYKPSELRQFLNELGASPQKKLSQNFLLDGNIINKIVKLAEVSAGDIVLEIGPGPGALTEALLAKGAKVIAVEKDHAFAEALKRLDSEGGRLYVLSADFMDVNVQDIIQSYAEGKKVKVIANLPYHLTTPIMTGLIPMHDQISSIIVMVQEEVARRFVAEPGGKTYGAITLFLNFYSQPQYGFRVSKNCFYPKPSVESAVLKFDLHPEPKGINPEDFFAVTREAFCHRRKMLHKALERVIDPQITQQALISIGKRVETRPEELSLEDFIALYKTIERKKG